MSLRARRNPIRYRIDAMGTRRFLACAPRLVAPTLAAMLMPDWQRWAMSMYVRC